MKNNIEKNIKDKNFLKIYTIGVVVTTVLAVLLVFAVIGLLSYKNAAGDGAKTEITNDVVIERVEEKFFAVTRTVYTDQEARIKIPRDSDLDELIRGKEVVGEARVRTDLGVDFEDLSSEDIVIDHESKKISISGVEAEILDSSIYGDLTVEVEGTIFTKIFDNTSTQDYQNASKELISSAQRAVESDEELMLDAKESTEQFLNYLFQDSGYIVDLV